MKQTRPQSKPMQSQLLILPDGSVLANNLTPAMAAMLERIHLHPDANTQRTLTRNPGENTIVDSSREGENEGSR